MLLSFSVKMFLRYSKLSDDFPVKKITLPKNFCSSSAMDGILFSPMKNSTILEEPLDSEKDLHFDGFSFIPIDSMLESISLMIF